MIHKNTRPQQARRSRGALRSLALNLELLASLELAARYRYHRQALREQQRLCKVRVPSCRVVSCCGMWAWRWPSVPLYVFTFLLHPYIHRA